MRRGVGGGWVGDESWMEETSESETGSGDGEENICRVE